MSNSTETPSATAGAGSGDPRARHECDFCGRSVHPATAAAQAQPFRNEPESLLCRECAVGAD